MDTGEYETNALLINNISSINFAFYEPVSPPAASFGVNALELESPLRSDGYLVHVDTARRGVWCFRITRKDGSASDSQHDPPTFPRTLERCGFTLSIAEWNAFEPLGLARNRLSGPTSSIPPNSSSSSGVSGTIDGTFRIAQSATPSTLQPLPVSGIEQDSKTSMSSDARTGSSALPIKDAYEALVSAVASAVSSSFCRKTGAIPLNPRTFLLPNSSHFVPSNSSATLGTLRIYLTTTGTLLISISLSRVEGIIPLSEHFSRPSPPLNLTVLAAPLGVFATYQTIATGNGDTATPASLAHSPTDTQISRYKSEKAEWPWRNICSKLLQARNISSASFPPQGWLSVHRVRPKPAEHKADERRTPLIGQSSSMSWPSSLCFCKAMSKLSIVNHQEENATSHSDRNYDPLLFAKTWFLGQSDREEVLSQKKKEREHITASAASEATLTEPPIQSETVLSPLALRQTAAPSGPVYLTPPDNIQSAAVGVTPTIDGTLSSPGNHVVTTTMADVDAGSHIPPEHDGENWEHTENKRERTNGSFDSENLFGELGPDMFGDTDVTEADFNFFDDQPGGMDLSSLELPDMPNFDQASGLSAGLRALDPPNVKTEGAGPQAPGGAMPVFAKPELKHARSSLVDEKRQTEQDRSRGQPTGLKRPLSPFTPDTVYKRVRASIDNHKAVKQNSLIYGPQHTSIFEKVDFSPILSVVNSKYQDSGRFSYSAEPSKGPHTVQPNGPPTTEYLKRHGKGRKGLKEQPASIGQLFVRASNAHDPASGGGPSPMEGGDAPSDADEFSLASDQDESGYESDEPHSPTKSMSTRRRRADDDGESLAISFKELECGGDISPNVPLDPPSVSKCDMDLPLSRYFADPEPGDVQLPIPDKGFMIAAQLVMDQAATATLAMPTRSDTTLQSKVDCRRELLHTTRCTVQELRSSLPSCVGVAAECQFRPLIEVQDVPFLNQPTRMQPRPPGAEQMRPPNLWQMPSPHFALRRYESKLSVLPSAVTFWESLGLGPSQGNKDINSICVFPDFPGMADSMLVFTDRMRSVYESFKLGSFNRLPSTNDVTDGLVAFEVRKTPEPFRDSSTIVGLSLSGGISRLCKALSSMTVKERNFVVFFVYSPDVADSIVESCIAFHQLFEGYKALLPKRVSPVVNELALQLIPIDFVSSSTSLANPTPTDFAKLALETYDRCTLFGGPMPSPAIVLEQLPPRHIDFKLTSNPSASLLQENSCLHVAYAQSVDERWIAAAWTDNRGVRQLTSSYCLGRKGKCIATPFADVAQEIWETTRELISSWKVHWRIIITKCGAMDQHEIDLWSALAQSESKATMSLTLLTVDTDPSLQLIPPAARLPINATSAFYTTPVSTPQPSTVSPEQSAPTPGSGGDAAATTTVAGATSHNSVGAAAAPDPSDADATLTDVTDHTWGAVLAHRLSISPHVPAADLGQTALISGYLVKRGGPRLDDPPALIEVNLVHVHQYGSSGGNSSSSNNSSSNNNSGVKESGMSSPGGNSNPTSGHYPHHLYHHQQAGPGPGPSHGQSSPSPSSASPSSPAQPAVHTQTATPLPQLHPRAYEPLLRDVLAQFRALGSLARARGVADREVDARPWHIAAAEKGVRALYLLM